MQDDDDTYAGAMRRTQERTRVVISDAIEALDKLIQEQESMIMKKAVRFESAVLQPYREAGSPYGDDRSAALQWFYEQKNQPV
jgi:hypothetical protein